MNRFHPFRPFLRIKLAIGCLFFIQGIVAAEVKIEWSDLPRLPQPLSGHFVGVHNGTLLVGGGSDFPVSLFEGGEKQWYSDVYALDPGASEWKKVGNLANPLAYASTVSNPDGIVVIGGSDADKHYSEVFRLRIEADKLVREELPSLPSGRAYASAALIESTVYLIGGRATPDAPNTLSEFLALDLKLPNAGWTRLEDCPGPSRMLAPFVHQDGILFLFGGTTLVPDDKAEGGVRRYLTDSYSYKPGEGWNPIAEVPEPSVAASIIPYGQSHILIFGGDDGALVDQIQELKDEHPGFTKNVHAYHTLTDSWIEVGDFPEGYVTTHAVMWNEKIVIPGGEDRPGHRGDRVLAAQVSADRKSFVALDYAAVVIYLALLVGMGFYFSKREHTTEDFFLAGRRIPWWAAGLSIFGTQLSAITFLAIPATSYANNWLYFLVNMTIIAIAPVVVFCYLPFFRGLNVTTAYEFLERRFNVGARLFGSLTFVLFQMGRMGIVTFLPALALSAATGVDIFACILLMGVLATFYTVLGGMEAVIWTDVAQVFVLVGGALIALVLMIAKIDGGFSGLLEMANEADKFHMMDWGWDATLPVVWVVVVGQICANLVPYTSDQTVIQRYLTTKTEAQARNAIWTNAFMTLPATLLFCGVGTALYGFYKTHPQNLDPTLQTDAIFPLFIVQELPPGVAGLVVAGIFAASMSSLDSSMNSLATVVTTDFYRRFKGPTDEQRTLVLARVLTAFFGVLGTGVALLMATFDIKSFMDLYIKLLGFIGGSLAGLFALGVFSKRANGPGALIGAIAGAGMVAFIQTYYPVHFFLNATISMGTCMGVGYVFSFVFAGNREGGSNGYH